MIVSIVAEAGVGRFKAWIHIFWLSKQITSVRLNHESLNEVVIEEGWQQSLTIPRIDCKQLRLKLLFHWWHIVLYLKHEIHAIIIQRFCKDNSSTSCRYHDLGCRSRTFIWEYWFLAIIIILIALKVSVIFCSATKTDLVPSIESIRILVSGFISRTSCFNELVEELSFVCRRITNCHWSHSKHIHIEVNSIVWPFVFLFGRSLSHKRIGNVANVHCPTVSFVLCVIH